jgi:hypothetical protein
MTTTHDPAFADWYSARVEHATTDQGLRPVLDALSRAGVPHSADQTGGFCMCVNIPLREGGSPYFYATANDLSDPFGSSVDVGMYWDHADERSWHSEGVDVAYAVPVDDLAALVRSYVAKSDDDLACPYEGETWHN